MVTPRKAKGSSTRWHPFEVTDVIKLGSGHFSSSLVRHFESSSISVSTPLNPLCSALC